MSSYPNRCPLFALHYSKWLFASGASHEVGPDATALILAVVMLEDEFGCQRPVNFFNEQLMDRCGIKSEHSLIRARKIAVDAGLLQYDPGKKRQPGRYFVSGFTAENAAKVKRKSSESQVKSSPSTPIPNNSLFIRPQIEEISSYWTQGKLAGDPEEFFDHFTANGWTQGRQSKPIKDWKAAARNWSRNAVKWSQPADQQTEVYKGLPRI
jgi:hypothetical protein